MTSLLLKTVKKRERRKLYTGDEVEADAWGALYFFVLGVFGIVSMILGGGL